MARFHAFLAMAATLGAVAAAAAAPAAAGASRAVWGAVRAPPAGARHLSSLRLRGGAAATAGEVTEVGTKQAFDLILQQAGDKLVVVDFTAQCACARRGGACASATHARGLAQEEARAREEEALARAPPTECGAAQGVGRASG